MNERKNERMDDVRTDRRIDGPMDPWTHGHTDHGPTGRGTDGPTDGRTNLRLMGRWIDK